MKQGFLSTVFSEWKFEDVIDFASENGFRCVELACWPREKAERRYAGVTHLDVDEMSEEKKQYIISYCKDRNVEISSLAYYPNMMDPDLQKREQNISHLKKLIRISADLGVNMVSTFIGRIPDKTVEENLNECERVWTPIMEAAEAAGVRIAIENCPMLFTDDEWPGGKNLASTPPIWRQLFKRIPSPLLGLNYDPSHFVWQKMDYIRPIYEFRDRIFHVHYKDIALHEEKLRDVGTMSVPLKYMTPRIPGHGDVDWAAFISALLDIGYKGAACIEIEDKAFEDSTEHIQEAVLISRRYLSQYIGRWPG